MIVPDASAVGLLFCDPIKEPRVSAAQRVLNSDLAWAVPEHWRIEVLSIIRSLHLKKHLNDARSLRAVAALAHFETAVVPTVDLLGRIWQLCNNLSAYDAGYVAAAELMECTLLTADARIQRAGVAKCPIQVLR